MLHQMKLKESPFERIKNGTKTIEFRLYDEKRKQIKIGDKIEFSKLPELEEKIVVEFKYDLIQPIKGKNIIQAIDFSTNKTDIFDNEFDLALEMTNANIEHLEDGIKVYNEEQEVLLNDNGKFITE